MISQLKVLQRADTKANKFDKEVWANELGPVLNLWKKLNQVNLHVSSLLEMDVNIVWNQVEIILYTCILFSHCGK